MVNASNSKMDAQVSYGVGPLSAGCLGSFQKEDETVVSIQGVKSGVLGVDSGRGQSSGLGVETANFGQGKMSCATTVGFSHCISVSIGNVSSSGSSIGTFGSGACNFAAIGIGNQTAGISSSLMEEVMTVGPCQKLDEFPSILDSQIWQSKAMMVEEGWTPVTRKESKKALPQFDMNLCFHKKGVKRNS